MEKRSNKERKRKIAKGILAGFRGLHAKRTYSALGGC